jgi:polysaccharide biosynthesis protein VpsM
MSYKFATRYTAKLFYRNVDRQFDKKGYNYGFDPEWDNYTENDMGGSLYYRFLPKTSVLFEYGFTHHNQNDRGLTDTNRDYDAQRYWLGLMWEPTAKIVGTIKGGYYQRNYDSGSTSKDWSGFAMENDLKYKLTSYDTFTLTGFRKPLETSVTASHVPGFAPGIYGTFYISTGGTLAYVHRFTYKISGIADVSFFNDDYREKGSLGKRREDDRFAGGIGALYQIQDWLAFKLGYRYTNNDSNADDESYKENLFSGTLSLNF